MLLHHLCDRKRAGQRLLWPHFGLVRCQGSSDASARRAFSKPTVWMRLHPDEGSHRAAAAHTDVVRSHSDISTHHHNQFQELKQLQDCLFYILHLTRPAHTPKHAHTYLIIYHLHAQIHLLWRLLTRLVIAATLLCIHMRGSQSPPFLSLFLSYEYKIVKAESKEILEISSTLPLSLLSPCGIFSDTWLNYFILLRGDQV